MSYKSALLTHITNIGISTGELFIVMLHNDLNENKALDFVFVDDVNVMDKAVFEGNTMIGHAIPAYRMYDSATWC